MFNASEVTISSDELPLLINPVFSMLLMELPDRAVQNQPFEATISVTNQVELVIVDLPIHESGEHLLVFRSETLVNRLPGRAIARE